MANTFTSFYNADVNTSAELTFTGSSTKESIISSLKVANIDGTNDGAFTCTITDNAATSTFNFLKSFSLIHLDDYVPSFFKISITNCHKHK